MTLEQTVPLTLPISDGDYGALTVSGLEWTLQDGALRQQPGATAKCTTMSPVCKFISSAVHDPETDSPFDFDGIVRDFPIQFGALLLDVHDPFTADASNPDAISVTVSSSQPMIPPSSNIFNSAAIFHFTLRVEPEGTDVE